MTLIYNFCKGCILTNMKKMKPLRLLIIALILIPFFGLSQTEKTESIVTHISSQHLFSINSLKHQPIDTLCKNGGSYSRGSNTETGELIRACQMTKSEDECLVVEYFYHENELIFILIGSDSRGQLDEVYIVNSEIIESTLAINQSSEYLNDGLNILEEFNR
jgi:hypothetical protein